MVKEAARIGAGTFQFFTRNPRGGKAKALNPDDVSAGLEFATANDIAPFLAHAPYTLNPASPEERLQVFTRETMRDDLDRLEHTPGNMYNLHPGRSKEERPKAIKRVAEILNAALSRTWSSTVLLETMAGHGSELGGSFEEIRDIIDATGTERGGLLGVCLDTCHVFDGGYDIVNRLDAVLEDFDRIIGLSRLKAVHLNDSKNPLGSGKDRHAPIGEGYIGLEAFGRIINHPALRDLPFYLETPNDGDGHAREIALLKNLYRE